MKLSIANLISRFRGKATAALLACTMLIVAVVGTLAFFTDRETSFVQFTTASFTKDGYTLTTDHPNEPFIANEDVVVKITEQSTKEEDVTSTLTMTVTWDSPDPDCNIFGNKNEISIKVGNQTIAISDENISNDGKSVTFDLPAQTLTKTGGAVTRNLTLHIPDSLMGTGTLSYTYDKAVIQAAGGGFSTEYSNSELNAVEPKHDFTVNVGWAASSNTTLENGKTLMGYLVKTVKAGEYTIKYQFEYNKNASGMKDFTSAALPRWSSYKEKVVGITIPEGVSTVGDYCFTDFEGISELTLPESMTAIGAYAFDNISIETLTLPAKTVTFEAMSFGHINELTEITFNAAADADMSFPTAGDATGAFFVDPYVPTVILGANDEAQSYDWVSDQRRVIPVIRAYTYTWSDDAVDPEYYIPGWTAEQVDFHADAYRNEVKSVVFADANTYHSADHRSAISAMKEDDADTYTSGNITYWNVTDAEHAEANPNAAYSVIAAFDSTNGKLTIMGDGNRVFANEDSSFLFGLFDNVDTIDAAKYDTRYAKTMQGWHYFNDPPMPAPDEPNYDDIQVSMLGANEIIGEESWDMSNVTSIADMFHNAKNIASLSVGDWNTESLVYANGAFKGCGLLTTLPVDDWDTSNVVDLRATFARCEGLTSLPVENWDVSKVENLDMTFSRVMGVKSLDLSKWDTSGLTGWAALNQTFQDSGFESLNLANWDLTNVTDLSRTFMGTSKLNSLDLHTWDISSVESMYRVFSDSGLETINVSGWDFSSCTSASDLFANCSKLTDIIGEETWATTLGNVGTFESMFEGCEKLQSVDVANWDVSGSKYGMQNMFAGCKSLTSIPVNNWDVSITRNLIGMFKDCQSLTDEGIDISGWDLSGLSGTSYIKDMFNGCRSLTKLTFPEYVNFLAYGMAANCPNLETIEFLSTSDTLRSTVSPGGTNEYSVGAFYVSPDDASKRYPATGKIPTTIISHGAGIASITEGIYTLGKDNRSTPGAENMLMYGSSWYQSTQLRNTMTSITMSLDESDTPASYDEVWDASVNQDGSIMAYRVGTDLYIIGTDGEIYANPNSTNAFGSMSGSTQFNAATSFEGLELLNTSKLKDATNMFAYFKSAEVLDVSTWDTSSLEILNCTFAGCEALKHLDLTNWTINSLTKYSVPFSSGTNIEEVTIGAGITDFTLFKLRELNSATTFTFLHKPGVSIELPEAGTNGAFRVPFRMDTTVITDNADIKAYDWYNDRRDVSFISTPDEIEVATQPDKTEYKAGENFDPSGLEITVTYKDGTTGTITSEGITVVDGNPLAAGQTEVTISYKENGETVYVKVPVSVTNPLEEITVKTQPTKTEYTTGETFDPDGMVIEATLADGSKVVVDDYTFTPNGPLTTDDTEVTISYEKDGETVTITVPITVKAPAIFTTDGNGTITGLTAYGKTLSEITIPAKIGDETITTVGADAFGMEYMSRVTIEDGITTIGNQAFKECYSLEEVVIPSSVTYIGGGAFHEAECTTIVFGHDADDTLEIGLGAFYYNNAYWNNITVFVPDASNINSAISGYDWTGSKHNVTFLNFGANVTTLPTKTEYTVGDTFSTTGMVITHVNEDGTQEVINSYTVSPNGALTTDNTEVTISYEKDGKTYTVKVPITVTAIFTTNGKGKITGLTDYGKTLSEISIPDKIGDETITAIGASAFNGLTSLTRVTIPDGVTSIGSEAFRNCTSLASVTIPDGMTSIGTSAFCDCTSLTSITIPASVTSIGGTAFTRCTNLTSVYITDLAAWCTIDFLNVYANPLMLDAAKLYLNGKLVTDLVIPDGVTSIGNYAFSGCTSLTSVTIPASVTSIGNYAFSGCTSLTSVTIPASVTSIGGGAFASNPSLTKATFRHTASDTLTFGYHAFAVYGTVGLDNKPLTIYVPDVNNINAAFNYTDAFQMRNVTYRTATSTASFNFNGETGSLGGVTKTE